MSYNRSVATLHASIAAVFLAISIPVGAQAQVDSARLDRWELRITSGSFLPVGEQRKQLERGPLSTIQVSWLPYASLAVTGTVGWARSRDRIMEGSPRLNAFGADLGVEARARQIMVGNGVTLSPFAGAGTGLRSYDYRSRQSDATHNLASYATVGGEAGAGRFALRIEARDYVGGFAQMDGSGTSANRNDVMLLVSLRFNRRANAQR